MAEFLKSKPHIGLLLLLTAFFMVSLPFMEGYYGGADNISHYLISRYAFDHPSLFLNAWGRPLYTLLSAPFAQFGLNGARTLNILLATSTAWIAYLLLRSLAVRNAIPVIFLVCFTPLYFFMIPTALTEILFGFILVLAVYLFFGQRFVAAAVVASFLPFARTEGFVLLPLFLVAFLAARKYRAIPFLASGVVIFSLAGSLHFRDLFWVFSRFPYPVTYTHPVYNTEGSPWHFLASRDYWMGLPVELLFIAGLLAIAREVAQPGTGKRPESVQFALLVPGSFLLYLALHSVLYWKAMGGSMGLERVLAAVLPMASVTAAKGLDFLLKPAGQESMLRRVLTLVVVAVVVTMPFFREKYPYPLSPEELTVREACQWLAGSDYKQQVVYYADNNVPFYLGLDPWEKEPASCHLFGDAKYLDTIPPGAVLVWDAHFGINESKIPRDSLLDSQRHKIVQYFRPQKPWITFGGHDYDCMITLAVSGSEPHDNYHLLDSAREALDARTTTDTLFFRTFENPGDAWGPEFLQSQEAFPGNHAFMMDARSEFSPGLYLKTRQLPPAALAVTADTSLRMIIRASMRVFLPRANDPSNTLLVISFEKAGKPYRSASLNLNQAGLGQGRWRRVILESPVPVPETPDDLLKVYLWNPGKQDFLVDDFRVELAKSQP